MSGSRCTGDCCRFFSLGSPEEFQAMNERLMNGTPSQRKEAELVRDMVIYRGYVPNPLHGPKSLPWHWWTCRHFGTAPDGTGFCSIYDERPGMCRAFPENYRGDKCPYPNCTRETACDSKEERMSEEKSYVGPSLGSPGDLSPAGAEPMERIGRMSEMSEVIPEGRLRRAKPLRAEEVSIDRGLAKHEMQDCTNALRYMLLAAFNSDNERATRWQVYIRTTFTEKEISLRLAALTGLSEEEAKVYINGASVPLPSRR